MNILVNGEINLDYIRAMSANKYSDVQIHNRLRGVILDGELPLPKVVGLSFVDGDLKRSSASSTVFTIRNDNVLESTLELINNLAELVIMPVVYEGSYVVPSVVQLNPEPVGIDGIAKPTYSKEGVFKRGPNIIRALDDNLYLLTAIGEVAVKLVIAPVTGNTSMLTAMGLVRSIVQEDTRKSFIAVHSRATLEKYIRFIPKGDGLFKIKLINGMTEDDFNLLVNHYGRDVVW